MRINDLFITSLRQVIRHRTRYWGVALIIALGSAGLVTIVPMGQEFKKRLNADLDLIGGVTLIRAFIENRKPQKPNWFIPSTAEALRDVPGVSFTSEVGGGRETIRHQGQTYETLVVAVDQHFWQACNYNSAKGVLFGAPAVKGRKKECVIGVNLAKEIFGHTDVLGKILLFKSEPFQVVGLLGGTTNKALSHAAFLPISTAQDRLGWYKVDRLYIRCATWDDVEKVADIIPGVVAKHQSDQGLFVAVHRETLTRILRISLWTSFFVYLALASTMVLGGTGIWTVMKAMVRTRTREIGLKKAIGALDRDILAQFLTESLCLSLGASLAGEALGVGGVFLFSHLLDSKPPLELLAFFMSLSLAYALILGIGAGLYPSLQASRMEVVKALKYE